MRILNGDLWRKAGLLAAGAVISLTMVLPEQAAARDSDRSKMASACANSVARRIDMNPKYVSVGSIDQVRDGRYYARGTAKPPNRAQYVFECRFSRNKGLSDVLVSQPRGRDDWRDQRHDNRRGDNGRGNDRYSASDARERAVRACMGGLSARRARLLDVNDSGRNRWTVLIADSDSNTRVRCTASGDGRILSRDRVR